jgi:hypothetical protein
MKPHQKLLLTATVALAAAAVSTGTAQALGPFTLNFDSLPTGTQANLFAPIGLDIEFGVYGPSLDGFGDPILGTDHWSIDGSAPSVLAESPLSYSRGTAPSPANALNALDQTVLFLFDAPIDVTHFSTVLDNSTFGNLGTQNIDFYDASDTLLFSLPTNQSTPGFNADYDGLISGVSKVVLPGNAFYDNVNVVPEPSAAVSLLGGFGLLLGWHRRRRG